MDANQNPPSERDWTEQEKDEFYASIGLSGTPINNAPYHPSPMETEPITLSGLVKMKEDFDKQFPEPLKYQNGADMSPETWNALKIGLVPRRTDGRPLFSSIHSLVGIDVHFVPDMPFGAVEECRCHQRKDYLDALEFKEKRNALPME